MKNFFTSVAAVAIASIGFVGAANAAVLFSQTPVAGANGFTSVSGPNAFSTTRQADNFVCTGAVGDTCRINAINFFGNNFLAGSTDIVDNFTVTFYADSAGVPGTVLSSQNVGDLTPIGTGTLDGSSIEILSYDSSLSDVIVNAGVTYWVSVVNAITAADPTEDWLWSNDENSSATSAESPDAVSPFAPTTGNFAFQLRGDRVPAVAEPASIALLGAGLGLVAFARRRRA